MSNDKKNELRITGVGDALKKDLQYMADHAGISRNSFVRMKLQEIRNAAPANLKRPLDPAD
jgi:hypothetical protein